MPAIKEAKKQVQFKLSSETVGQLDQLKKRHGDNRTAALEHAVRRAAAATITMIAVPGEPGLWVPETAADWGVHRRLCRPRPGDRSDQEGLVGRLVARAAEEGITVVFRPGSADTV